MTTNDRARGALWLLLILNLLVYMTRYAPAGVLPLLEESLLGVSKQQLGYLATVFAIVYLMGAPPFGLLGDRVRRGPLLAFGVLLSGLATAAGGLQASFGLLLVSRALTGLGQAAFVSIAPALLSDLYPASRRGAALGVFSIGQPVGTALSYMAGGVLVAFGLGWQGVLLVLGLPTALAGLAALRLHEPRRGACDMTTDAAEERQPMGHPWRRYLALLRNRSYLINTLAMSANGFAMGGFAYWGPTYLHTEHGISVSMASLGFGLVTASAGAMGTLGGGAVGDRLVRRFVGGHALLSGITMLAAVPLLYVLFFSVKQPVLVWMVIGASEVLLFANTSPSLAILMNVTAPDMRASANAFNMVVAHLLGEMFAPVIIGALADDSNMTAGLGVAAVAIGVSGLLWLLCMPFIAGDERRARGG
ncbi:MAG: MFS transporter [Deltaproteobacteria bacterium]|nr:MFS transporter [Deltaproteobacteria bacterium]